MSLRVVVPIQAPLPTGFPQSYGNLQYGKYGVACFQYAQGNGPVRWVNFMTSMFEPEYDDPINFLIWKPQGVVMKPFAIPYIPSALTNMKVNGNAVNILTGKGFPVSIT